MFKGSNESSLKIPIHPLLTEQLLLTRRRLSLLNTKAYLLQIIILLPSSVNQVNQSCLRQQGYLQTYAKHKKVSDHVLRFHPRKGIFPDDSAKFVAEEGEH